MQPRLRLERLDAIEANDAWFDAGERRRLETMRASLRRRQFLAGHGLARRMLAEHTGVAPADWRWDIAPGGAPTPRMRREGPNAGLAAAPPHLSLGHSGEWVACVLADEPVGLDLEFAWRPRELVALAEHAFCRAEAAALAALPPDARASRFHLLWSLREAWAKRAGDGFAVSRSRAQQAIACSADDAGLVAWSGEGWVLALAVARPARAEVEGLREDATASYWRIEDAFA